MDEKKRSELLGSVFDSLTEEQKKKAAACKTAKELLDYLAEAGIELPDEMLESAAGGIPEVAVQQGVCLKGGIHEFIQLCDTVYRCKKCGLFIEKWR